MLRSTITAVRGPRPGTRPRSACATWSTGAPASSPACGSGSARNPLSIAPPRWEVDPNFDLDFHLRFVRAGGDRSVRSVLDLAEPIAMQGFDRARPLWEITVVEGLEDDQAALILKVHHAITDGVGAVQIALVMFELERATGELDDMPDAPEAAVLGQVGRFWDALDHERRRNLGIAKRSAGTVVGGLRSALGDPAGTVERAGATAASVARMVAPATAPLSPLMTGRSLSVHFDTLSVGAARGEGGRQAGGRHAQRRLRGRDRGRLPPVPRGHGRPKPTALRMTMPINVRTEETSRPGRQPVRPRPVPDPPRHRRPGRAHPGHPRPRGRAAGRAGAGPGRAAGPGAEPAAHLDVDRHLRLDAARASTSSRATCPVRRSRSTSPAARSRRLFAFGPMTGAAANLTLLSYLDDLHIGINLDPAAVTEPGDLRRVLPGGLGRAARGRLTAVGVGSVPSPS